MKIFSKNFLLCLLIVSVNISCRDNNNSINIEKGLFNKITCKLSDFTDSISYIMLETNNDCLLPANTSILYIDDEDVFIRGGNYIYRFDRNGVFRNKIGKIGGGPAEYPQLYNADVDVNQDIVLMLVPPGNVYMYDYKGVFIKKIELNNHSQVISYIGNSNFTCVVNQYLKLNSTFLNIYNYAGELMQQHTLDTDQYNLERSLLSIPIVYKTGKDLNIKFIYNDTIFKFTNGGISVAQILNTGKYCPNRELVEDWNRKESLMNDYLQIVDIVETNEYLFCLSIWKAKTFGIVYNKKHNTFIYSNYIDNPKQGGGIENDLTMHGKFWPMKSIGDEEGGKIAHLIYPHDAGFTHMDYDSNPIIQIVHLK